jgi:quercetin dioxygenase-like cupin family protein
VTAETNYRGPFGDTLRWIAGDDETGGAYAMLERTAPPGTRSRPHDHLRSEAFYVIGGELSFTLAGDAVAAKPGSYVIAPAGVAHGWEVTGDRDARVLLIFAPSAPRAYFAEIDGLVRAGGGVIDAWAMTDVLKRYGWM